LINLNQTDRFLINNDDQSIGHAGSDAKAGNFKMLLLRKWGLNWTLFTIHHENLNV